MPFRDNDFEPLDEAEFPEPDDEEEEEVEVTYGSPCPECGQLVYEDIGICPHCEQHVISPQSISIKPFWVVVTAAFLLIWILLYWI